MKSNKTALLTAFILFIIVRQRRRNALTLPLPKEVGTNLEVMDSEEKLVSFKGDYIITLYNYNTSKASLDKAMGIPVDLDVEPYRQKIEKHAKKGE